MRPLCTFDIFIIVSFLETDAKYCMQFSNSIYPYVVLLMFSEPD